MKKDTSHFNELEMTDTPQGSKCTCASYFLGRRMLAGWGHSCLLLPGTHPSSCLPAGLTTHWDPIQPLSLLTITSLNNWRFLRTEAHLFLFSKLAECAKMIILLSVEIYSWEKIVKKANCSVLQYYASIPQYVTEILQYLKFLPLESLETWKREWK